MAQQFTTSLGSGGKTSLQTLLSLPDPLLSFKWVVTVLPFGLPTHYVESISLPFPNVEVGDKTHMGSTYVYYPGTHNISSFQLTLYEDHLCSASRYIWFWKNQIKDFKTGLYNLPSQYKQRIKVQLLDSKNNPVMTATLVGVWPSDTNNWDLNYTDTSGRLVVSQMFSVDDFEPDFHK